MKNSKSLQRAGIAAGAAALFATAALAGPRYSQPSVSIAKFADGGGHVMGTLGGVRNSASQVERLSCTVSRAESTSAGGQIVHTTLVSCAARDKNNLQATCTSTSDAFANALNGLSADGLIDFTYNSSGACTDITVYESASLEEKA